MIVNYWILPFALLLLTFPRQWLRLGGKVIGRNAPRQSSLPAVERDARDLSLKLKAEFVKVRNWVDLARAAAGSLAINYGCFSVAPGEAKIVASQILGLKAVLLVLAVVVQTIRIEQRLQLSAPVFFILGLSFGLIGWPAALFACVAVWTFNQVIPTAAVFLAVFAGIELCFGLLLARGQYLYIILSAVLAFLPLIISGLSRRSLVRLNKSNRSRRS